MLVCLYKLKEKELFPKRISSGQGGEKWTAQANICFTFFIMRFGLSMEVTSGSMGILPCSMLHCISTWFPSVLMFFCTLWQISESSHSVHVTVPQLPSSTGFLAADTKNAHYVSLEGIGNQLIPSLALNSQIF